MFFSKNILLIILINLGNCIVCTTLTDEINSVSFFTTTATRRNKNMQSDIESKQVMLNHINAMNKNLLNIYVPEVMPLILQQESILDVEDGLIQFLESVFESTDLFLFSEDIKTDKKILWFILEIRNKYFRFKIKQKLSILVENLDQITFETKKDNKPTNIKDGLKNLKILFLKKFFLKNKNFKVINEQKIKNEAFLNESIEILAQILTEFEFLVLNFHFDGSFEHMLVYLHIDNAKIRKTRLCETATNWVTGFFNKKSIFNILKEREKRLQGASIASSGIDLSNEECERGYFTFCSQLNMFFDFLRHEDRMKVFEKHFFDLFIRKKISFPNFSEQEIVIYINFFYQEKVLNIKLINIYSKCDGLYFQAEIENISNRRWILSRFSDKINEIPNDYHKYNLIFIDISFFRNSCVFDVKEDFDVRWSQEKKDISSIFDVQSVTFNQYLNFLRSLKLEIYKLQSKNLRFKIIMVEENIFDKQELAGVLQKVLIKHFKHNRNYSRPSIIDELTTSRIKELLNSTETNYTFYDEYLDVIDSLIEELSATVDELIRHKTFEVVFCDRKNDGSFDSQKVLSSIKNLNPSKNPSNFATSRPKIHKTTKSISNKKECRTKDKIFHFRR